MACATRLVVVVAGGGGGRRGRGADVAAGQVDPGARAKRNARNTTYQDESERVGSGGSSCRGADIGDGLGGGGRGGRGLDRGEGLGGRGRRGCRGDDGVGLGGGGGDERGGDVRRGDGGGVGDELGGHVRLGLGRGGCDEVGDGREVGDGCGGDAGDGGRLEDSCGRAGGVAAVAVAVVAGDGVDCRDGERDCEDEEGDDGVDEHFGWAHRAVDGGEYPRSSWRSGRMELAMIHQHCEGGNLSPQFNPRPRHPIHPLSHLPRVRKMQARSQLPAGNGQIPSWALGDEIGASQRPSRRILILREGISMIDAEQLAVRSESHGGEAQHISASDLNIFAQPPALHASHSSLDVGHHALQRRTVDLRIADDGEGCGCAGASQCIRGSGGGGRTDTQRSAHWGVAREQGTFSFSLRPSQTATREKLPHLS
ncbi:hypothetical protein BDK51DRAFT_52245 [Blyttiomyces helicus]|uniref:Uncharacterized protein n=1 Tax=Blyttiomyces helicus TaxID=388810 RepID=A0A4P9W646_9FUNG|nr:hypothetical protein BDK51DRAFT_52245 [Blyttiomyces helicus]|eukprot:RKO86220.1 hypothetical protein BDK51DRAFT_52245 [Blyttiomyces helicus]